MIAYGISAGGTIAAALTATGRVTGAGDVIGPTDVAHWLDCALVRAWVQARWPAG